MTDFYSQNRCVCSTRSHGPLLCAFCLSFHFNMFLSTIGSEINTELKQTNHAVGTSSLLNRTGFKFEPVTEMSVINTMHNLKNNKKGGKSPISTYIYKLLCPYIATKLTHLINEIISTNIFPVIWKEALVTPIPKPGARTNPSNYRPIS